MSFLQRHIPQKKRAEPVAALFVKSDCKKSSMVRRAMKSGRAVEKKCEEKKELNEEA